MPAMEGAPMNAESVILDQLREMRAQIQRVQDDGSERGRLLWAEMNSQGKTLVAIEHRMTAVEGAVAGAKPTLEEYQKRMIQVNAAGWIGHKLWKFGGWLLAAVAGLYAARDQIVHWFAGK